MELFPKLLTPTVRLNRFRVSGSKPTLTLLNMPPPLLEPLVSVSIDVAVSEYVVVLDISIPPRFSLIPCILAPNVHLPFWALMLTPSFALPRVSNPAITVPKMPSVVTLLPAPLIVLTSRMPPVPSASYLAPGLVTTSMLLMRLAGITLNIWEGLLLSIWLGLPSTYTLKDELPFTVMLSWASTVTIGTLRRRSRAVILLASMSCSTS